MIFSSLLPRYTPISLDRFEHEEEPRQEELSKPLLFQITSSENLPIRKNDIETPGSGTKLFNHEEETEPKRSVIESSVSPNNKSTLFSSSPSVDYCSLRRQRFGFFIMGLMLGVIIEVFFLFTLYQFVFHSTTSDILNNQHNDKRSQKQYPHNDSPSSSSSPCATYSRVMLQKTTRIDFVFYMQLWLFYIFVCMTQHGKRFLLEQLQSFFLRLAVSNESDTTWEYTSSSIHLSSLYYYEIWETGCMFLQGKMMRSFALCAELLWYFGEPLSFFDFGLLGVELVTCQILVW